MAEEAAIRFRYEIAGNGLASVEQLTRAVVALATAEDLVRARAKEAGAAVAAIGAAAPTGRGGAVPGRPPVPAAPTAQPSPGADPSARLASPRRTYDESSRERRAGTRRDNPLLDEVFGVPARQRSDSSGRADPGLQRAASAPRPGSIDENRPREASLSRSLDALTTAITRQTSVMESLGRLAPGTPPAERGGGGVAATARQEREAGPTRRPTTARPDTSPDDRREEESEASRALKRRKEERVGFVSGMVSGFGRGLMPTVRGLLDATAVPYADATTEGMNVLRSYQVPVLNLGLGDLRDLQQRMQVYGKGLSYEAQRRFLLQEERTNEVYLRPREEYAARNWLARQDAERRFQASIGRDDRVRDPHEDPALRQNLIRPYATTERETVGQRRQYVEERRLAPAIDRLTLARREEVVARGRVTDYDRHIERLEKDRDAAEAQAEKFRIEAMRAPNNDGGFARQRLYEQSRTAAGRATMLGDLAMKARDEQERARFDVVRLGGERRTAERAEIAARLETLREREDTARSQAQALAYAGPAGRAQADFALSVVREAGVANTPAEILAMARPLYGKTLDALAEREGQQFVPNAQANAPEEYRDTVSGITDQVNRLEKTFRDREQRDLPNQLVRLLDAFNSVADRDSDLLKQLQRVVQQIETDLRQAANQPR